MSDRDLLQHPGLSKWHAQAFKGAAATFSSHMTGHVTAKYQKLLFFLLVSPLIPHTGASQRRYDTSL